MIGKYKDKVPFLAESCFIADNSTVVGDVTIKENSTVWFGAVIRGDDNKIQIGACSNVQDNASIHVAEHHPVVIGDYVTIGHNAVIHGCVIEDDVLIGMGAIVLNGAHIGTGSIIGAGCVIRENDVIPPNSLVVGVPGKVKGQIGEDQLKHIRKNAMEYVIRGKEYLADGYGEKFI